MRAASGGKKVEAGDGGEDRGEPDEDECEDATALTFGWGRRCWARSGHLIWAEGRVKRAWLQVQVLEGSPCVEGYRVASLVLWALVVICWWVEGCWLYY